MKTLATTTLALLLSLTIFGQGREIVNTNSGSTSNTTTSSSSNAAASDFKLDYFIIGGSLGLGPILSTNLVNSGFIGESTIDLMIQSKHHRFGIGLSNTLMGTP